MIIKRFNESVRERINLSNIEHLESLIHGESYALKNTDYELVDVIKGRFDGEKGYVEYDIIIKRKSDDRYFKGEAEDWGKGERSVDPNFVEVYPKQKTITTYD